MSESEHDAMCALVGFVIFIGVWIILTIFFSVRKDRRESKQMSRAFDARIRYHEERRKQIIEQAFKEAQPELIRIIKEAKQNGKRNNTSISNIYRGGRFLWI